MPRAALHVEEKGHRHQDRCAAPGELEALCCLPALWQLYKDGAKSLQFRLWILSNPSLSQPISSIGPFDDLPEANPRLVAEIVLLAFSCIMVSSPVR